MANVFGYNQTYLFAAGSPRRGPGGPAGLRRVLHSTLLMLRGKMYEKNESLRPCNFEDIPIAIISSYHTNDNALQCVVDTSNTHISFFPCLPK